MDRRGVLDRLTGLSDTRLRTQYALVLLAILVVLGAVVVGAAEFFQQQTVEQEEAELQETANVTAELIDDSVEATANELIFWQSRIHDDLTNDAEVLERLIDNPQFTAGFVADDEGTVRTVEGDFEDRELALELLGSEVTEPYVTEPLETRRSYIQDPTLEADGQISLTMSEPVVTHNETTDDVETLGVIVAMVLFSPDRPELTPGFFSPLEVLDTTTQSATVEHRGEESLQLRSVGGSFEDNITSTATVDSTGWIVEVERDRGALTGQIRTLQFVQFGSFFVVLLSVLGLGFYQYRTTLQQTDSLLDGFNALSSGEFGHRLRFSGSREWEEIAAGFNSMAQGLRSREETIREREREIREREQQLSVLNRVLRHNVKNDLSVVIGRAQLIAAEDSTELVDESAEQIIEVSQGLVDHSEKARRLQEIMENAQGGLVTLDLAANVASTVDEYHDEYPEFEVETDLPERAPVMAVAGVEFGLESLVENAFEHTECEDPRIRVTVTREEEFTHLRIEDNGSGIPEQEQHILGQDEETSLEHGSGIGLWLAYWATVKSGGEFRFGDQRNGGSVTASLASADTEPDE